MLRAWMTESVKPAARHETLPGRWIAEPSWPPPGIMPRRLFLTGAGLKDAAAASTARPVCSLVFETAPLEAPIEILGAPIVTLDVASDRTMANLVVRLCDVLAADGWQVCRRLSSVRSGARSGPRPARRRHAHPSGESLRVSYGGLNLTHRDSHEQPVLLATGERYRVRIKLNDAGSVCPAGHKARLAISTAYWPMIWPSPEGATVQILAGTLDLPQRSPNAADARLSAFPEPETAPPEKPAIIRRDGVRIERIDRIGLESGTQDKTEYHVEDNDPLSAVAELHTQTLSRDNWQIRVETQLRMSATANAFLLQGSLRASEGANEVCHRDWDRTIARDFL